jgi:uncharacterized membrane-anchored protein YjiN (DUF445 family)
MFSTDVTSPEDLERRRVLRRMRTTAGGLLVLMLLLFLAAWHWEARYPWLSFVRAFAEAAMAGGIADWFAVTALFRHPLGLPIPHTAVVPRNKDRIADSLGSFIANNFLSPEMILRKLKAVDLASRLAHWLSQPDNARLAARRVVIAIPPLVAAMRDEPVRQMLHEAAVERLRAIAVGPLLARVLTVLAARGQHMALFSLGLEAARRFLLDNQHVIAEKIRDQSAWWVPRWLDARLAKRIVEGGLETLDEVCVPGHPWRQQFQDRVDHLIDNLAHSSETQASAEAVKEEIIRHPEVQAYLQSFGIEAKRVILADLAGGDRVERVLADALHNLGLRLREDQALREVMNAWANRAVLHLVVPNRHGLGAFLASVVQSWDTPTLVTKLELRFGRDLQFIRINGTVVGGLVGLVIHTLSMIG